MSKQQDKVRSARPVAPEDIRAGQFITVTRILSEETPLLCDASIKGEIAPVRAWMLPSCAGTPLRVVSVCLPFVLVQTVTGDCCTVDLRQMEIVRLPKKYGGPAFARLHAEWKRRSRP